MLDMLHNIFTRAAQTRHGLTPGVSQFRGLTSTMHFTTAKVSHTLSILLLLPAVACCETQYKSKSVDPLTGTASFSQEGNKDADGGKLKTIQQVESNLTSYIDKPVKIRGVLELSSQYLGPYSNSKESHYSFTLTDLLKGQVRTAYLYMKKNQAAETLKTKLRSNGRMGGEVIIRIL